jgi:hypothetical protein
VYIVEKEKEKERWNHSAYYPPENKNIHTYLIYRNTRWLAVSMLHVFFVLYVSSSVWQV